MPPAQQENYKQQSLNAQRVAAYMKMAQDNEELWHAILIFLATLFLLGSIPFYPVYLVFFIALLCGAIGYKSPQAGVVLGAVLALPAIAYQSAMFGWIYLLVLALVLFKVFDYWAIISVIEILILAPFAFGRLFFGWITILGMAIGAFHFGSKKSMLLSLPAMFAILLLSAIWQVDTGYFPIAIGIHQPGNTDLLFQKPPVEVFELGEKSIGGVFGLLSAENTSKLWDVVGHFITSIFRVLFADSGIVQLIGWAVALYGMSYLSGIIKQKYSATISSCALLLVILVYFGIGILWNVGFRVELAAAVIGTIVFVGILDSFGVTISRETEVSRAEQMKSFGKFGLQDMGIAKGEKGLDAVGGYEDVKQELRDAILLPLEKKDIAIAYGIKPPTGILLFGPPGTGKTMLMRALSSELSYGFYYVKSSDLLSMWVGESLPYDEKIFIRDCSGTVSLEEIGKIVEKTQDAEVLCFDKHGRTVFAEIKDWIKHKCTSPIYEVKTKTGRKIRVTDYHSLFTLKGTRIESAPTRELVAGKSYIAIPSRIHFSTAPLDEINLIKYLSKNDHGLYIKNAAEILEKAVAKLGRANVAQILRYKQEKQVNDAIKRNIGVRVGLLIKLADEASLELDNAQLLVGAGSKTLPGVIKMDEKVAAFIGLWIAEGSYNREDTLRLSVSETEIEHVSDLCRKLFGKVTIYKKKNSKGRDVYIGSRPLYILFRHVLGLEDGAARKKMPSLAFNLNKENLAALLRGYFSGDGNLNQNERGVITVEASTASSQLANDLLYLLLHFGVVASVHDKKEWNDTFSKRIHLTGYKKLQNFAHIGFFDVEKNNRIKSYLDRISDGWHRSELVPLSLELRNRAVSCMKTSWPNNTTIGKDVLSSIDFGEDEPEFLEYLENDIYLDRVEEIKRVNDERYVYDISVDPCQNFVGGFGGIFAHNSEKNVAELFSIARSKAPCILFFDEIDAIGKKRGASASDDVGPRVLTMLLQEMDGMPKTAKNPVLIMAATNIPNQLDPALLRPGRFDKIVYMHLPDKDARKAIFKVSLKSAPVVPDIDFDKLAAKTERFSGADIKNIAQEAVKLAAKEAIRTGSMVPIKMSHLMTMVDITKPSTSLASLEDYERFRLDFERRSGAKEEEKKEDATKWADVVGLDEVKRSLLETIELPLLHEAEMKEFRVKPTKGILLFGPPGTGKTLIVKAACNELKASFQALGGAELMKQGYTQAVTVIKETFNRARENTPAIVFVDEIETFAPARGISSSEIIGQFLTEMDGLKELKGVVVIGATNHPAILDPAILRPGRFDKIFYIPAPNEKGRIDMFKLFLGKFADGLDLAQAARMANGFSGADLAALCQTVKMDALRTKLAGGEPKVTEEMLLAIISKRRPSITQQLLDEYDEFKQKYGERR